MLENIKNIGIFMMIAQTVIHFSAGKTYEKYLKIISGVIVLLLFISPFVSSYGDMTAGWQTALVEMTDRLEQLEMTGSAGESAGISFSAENVQKTAQRKIEEQVKDRLNALVVDINCQVTGVEIEFVETDGEGLVFNCVSVMVQDMGNSEIAGGTAPADTEGVGKGAEASETSEIEKKVFDDSTVQKIEIDQIRIGGGNGTKKAAEPEAEQKAETEQKSRKQQLRRIFAQALEIAEDRVEVAYRGGW